MVWRLLGLAALLLHVVWVVSGSTSTAGLLECSGESTWSNFRQKLIIATEGRQLRLTSDLFDDAQGLLEAVQSDGAILLGAEQFYQDLCAKATSSFCLYGVMNALFIVAAGLQETAIATLARAEAEQAQDYLRSAMSLMGLQNCLDFVESSTWPVHSNDILANLNLSYSGSTKMRPFALSRQEEEVPGPQDPPPGSSLVVGVSPSTVVSLTSLVKCSDTIGVVAVGTHPTLTLEAVEMLRLFGGYEGHLQVHRTLGITYKCAVFPEMCGGDEAKDGAAAAGDPIAELIGPFDAPPAYETYTMSRIVTALKAIGHNLRLGRGFDLLVCTSPFVVCGVLQQVTDSPLLAYFGLPLLWKRPTDLFDDPTARMQFWRLLHHLHEHPAVVLAVNNPLLSEQIAHQAPGPKLPVIRPHAAFTKATYTPLRMNEALLISRTKFLWVTFGCVVKHFMPDGFPIQFTVANSDSRLSFQEMASHRAAVLVPWEHALMAFFELYSMAVPLLMPDSEWAYRLVFDPEGNLGSTTSQYIDVNPVCDAEHGCISERHAYPPFGFESLPSRRYWYQYSSFAQFPYIPHFSSVPDMLHKLVSMDLAQTSSMMKAFNDLTFVRSGAFWRQAAGTLLKGHSSCGVV